MPNGAPNGAAGSGPNAGGMMSGPNVPQMQLTPAQMQQQLMRQQAAAAAATAAIATAATTCRQHVAGVQKCSLLLFADVCQVNNSTAAASLQN